MICASLCRRIDSAPPPFSVRNHIPFRADLGEQVIADDHLDTRKLELIHRRNLLPYVCMYATSVALKNVYTSPSELLKLEVEGYETVLPESFAKVQKVYERLASKYAVEGEPDYDGLAKGPRLLKALLAELRRRFNPKKKNQK